MTLYRLFQAGSVFLSILRIAILVHWFLTLFNIRNAITQWLEVFIQPFVSPFRRLAMLLIEKTGMRLDFTYFFALIGLSVVNRLWWLLYGLFRGMRL